MKYKRTQFLYTYTVSYSTMELHPSQMVYSTQFLFVFLTQIVQISIKNIWWPFNIKVNSLDQNIDFFLFVQNQHALQNQHLCHEHRYLRQPLCWFSILYFEYLNVKCSHFQNVYFYLHACFLFFYFEYLIVYIPKMCILTSLSVIYFIF